jgi:hypothetical protein
MEIDEFHKIMDADSLGETGENLFYKLDAIEGVSGIEYDGHFGANVWFTVDNEHDTGKLHNQIEEIINGFIK